MPQIIDISPNPQAKEGNVRKVQFNTLELDDLAKEMKLWYTAFTYESDAEDAEEILRLRTTKPLIAKNDTKVNEQGDFVEEGIGEYDFYEYIIFSGLYTKSQLIKSAILRADANKRFDS